ncbi:MAG: HAMP domain-containing histidine kinase [Erysipelothrix sp.]|nr:HAMP domain-containing histidine kinase [Erysipelothrix sp.]
MRILTRRVIPILLAQTLMLGAVYFMIVSLEVPLLLALILGVIGESLLITLLLYNRRIKVSKLNQYLAQINQGRANLDLTVFTDSELGILRSELFRLSETLHRQNEQLVADKKFILDSLNDIAHQLKTPLTSVVMMVDLIQENDLPPEKQQQFMLNIESQLERLQGLIANLLTLSKLEANVINYQAESIMDTQLINRLVSSFDVELNVKNVHCEIETDNQLVTIDIDWTIEALSNIVKNAIEHMPDGGTIRILSTVNLMYWQIIIEDNGTGIKEEDIEHVFDRFYRGKTSRKDSVGIGLSLTKRIINQQKGLIKVESQVGQFTRFIIRFLK